MFMCFMGNVTFLLANLERILQGVDLLDILRVCLIDQHAHHDKGRPVRWHMHSMCRRGVNH
jgi:hypothetical protein